MREGFLGELKGVKEVIEAQDLTAGVTAGSRVDVRACKRVAFVIQVGSAASDLDVSLKQHTAASGGTTKALSVANMYFKKVGAATSFTKVEPESATDNYVDADFNAAKGILVLEILEDQLDDANGFYFASVNVAARAADGSVLAICDVNEYSAHEVVL